MEKTKQGMGDGEYPGQTQLFVVTVVFLGVFFQNAVINIVLTKNQMMLENVHERGEGASLATSRGGQKEQQCTGLQWRHS